MKQYIFLTFAIYGIGGTQIYVRNKSNYLKEKGWDIKVITTESKGMSSVVVKELLPYQEMVFPELMKNPNLYTPKEREKILDKVCQIIGEISKDSVIEANFIQVTFWGELLAKRLGIRNFIFLIQEDYEIRIKNYLKFFKYKFERGEFAVNTKYALKKLFQGFFEIPDGIDAYLSAVCHNTVEDCETSLVEALPKSDFTIASIGRINKPFVAPMLEKLTTYAKQHSNNTFLFLFIGGSPEQEDSDRLYRMVDQVTNIKILITGPIFPIPLKLMCKVDAYVASAGSAKTSADAGFPTIAIDANDYEPIGIVGYTTDDIVHRKPDKEIVPLKELLDDILYEKKYQNIPIKISEVEKELTGEFDKHMAYLEGANQIMQYYNIAKIRPAFGLRVNEICGRLRKK